MRVTLRLFILIIFLNTINGKDIYCENQMDMPFFPPLSVDKNDTNI